MIDYLDLIIIKDNTLLFSECRNINLFWDNDKYQILHPNCRIHTGFLTRLIFAVKNICWKFALDSKIFWIVDILAANRLCQWKEEEKWSRQKHVGFALKDSHIY